MEFFDCIVIGAGPAGLLLAKELSKKHKVLILEKNRIGDTNKNWVTYKDRWLTNKFPKSLIENEFNKDYVQMKHGQITNQYILNDSFICFNEHKFLRYLANISARLGCVIKESSPYKSFIRKKDKLIVNNMYTTNLLIDCAGIDSPIVKKYRLIDIPIYINCYAYIAEFDKLENKNYYCFYRKKNKNHYSAFGFTKTASKLAQLQYFKYSNNKPDTKKYEVEMSDAQKDFNIPNHKLVELKVASYPTGLLKKRELDNIFLFGDAGFYSPSLNGMGFNEILRQYRKVSKHISSCISNNAFSEKELKIPDDIADDVNNLLFRFLGLIFNDIPPKILDQFFTLIKKLPDSDIRRIMRNDVTDKEAIRIFKFIFENINLGELIRVMKKHHIKYILKTLYELDKDILTEEIHNLIFKHHKIRIQDMYN
jgi:flavin-dependent dehydrogenase